MANEVKPRVRVHADGRQELISFPALPATNGGKGAPSASYMRGNESPYFFSWTPALRDQRDDIRQGYVHAAARAIDGLHNSGWIAGAVEQSIASTIGTTLRLSSKPDFDLIGWDQPTANKWARLVERRWEAWACNPVECDAGGKANMGQMANAAMRSFFSHGETVGLLPIVNRRAFSTSRTKVKMLPAHKLLTDSDNIKMFQGVLMDDWGFPRAYRMRLRLDGVMEQTVDVRARDAAGRPQVFHIFQPEPDCPRGITPMAPVLRIVRQYDQLADATLTQALIQAIFAATVQSDAPTESILQALQDEEEQQQTTGIGAPTMDGYLAAKGAWYQNTKIDLGRSGRIAHLFPGEKLEFHGSEAPNATYEAFAKFLLREIARCLGMTFETLTGDYSGATYSSVRMATSEIWPVILNRRNNIAGRFYQTVFECWLEEEIETGRIPFKAGFEEFLSIRNAASRAEWRGPPKAQADDLKTAKAHEIYKRLGILSDDVICGELGLDWEDVYEQRAREMEKRQELKLPETDTIEPPGETGDRLDDLDR